jgi:hypothetical protein
MGGAFWPKPQNRQNLGGLAVWGVVTRRILPTYRRRSEPGMPRQLGWLPSELRAHSSADDGVSITVVATS